MHSIPLNLDLLLAEFVFPEDRITIFDSPMIKIQNATYRFLVSLNVFPMFRNFKKNCLGNRTHPRFVKCPQAHKTGRRWSCRCHGKKLQLRQPVFLHGLVIECCHCRLLSLSVGQWKSLWLPRSMI